VVLPEKLPATLLKGLLGLHERIYPKKKVKSTGSPVHVPKGVRSIGYFGPTQTKAEVWPGRKLSEVHHGSSEDEDLIAATADFIAKQSGRESVNTRMFVDIMCSRKDQTPQRWHQDGVSPLLAFVVMISEGPATLFAPYEGLVFQRLNREKRLAFLETAWDAADKCKDNADAESAGMLEAGQIVAFNSCHIHKGPPVAPKNGNRNVEPRRTMFFACETKETGVSEGVVFAESWRERFEYAQTRAQSRVNPKAPKRAGRKTPKPAAKKPKLARAPAPAIAAIAAATADPGSGVVAGAAAVGVVVAADNLAVGYPVPADAAGPADATPQAIKNWLTGMNLVFEDYATCFEDAGCENVGLLSEVDSGDLDDIMAKAGVKHVHAKIIRKNHQAILAHANKSA
jgi:hypothetical protein